MTYTDNANGKVNERNYRVLMTKYEQEQTSLVNRIEEIESTIENQNQNVKDVNNFVDMIKDYANLIELDAPLLNRLINKITVSETTLDGNGEPQQEINIFYKFVGKLD